MAKDKDKSEKIYLSWIGGLIVKLFKISKNQNDVSSTLVRSNYSLLKIRSRCGEVAAVVVLGY